MGRPKKEKSYSPTVTELPVAVGVPSDDHKKPIRTCFYCKEEMTEGYKLYPLDKPYINLFFHLSCLKEIEKTIQDHKLSAIDRYVTDHAEEIYKYAEEMNMFKNKQKSKLMDKKVKK